MRQQTENVSTLDMRRAYPAHCPSHRSVHRANHALLMVDSRLLKHGNYLFSMCMVDSVIFILEEFPASSSTRHRNINPRKKDPHATSCIMEN